MTHPDLYQASDFGPIPDDWSVQKLGELFSIQAGGDFDPAVSSIHQSETHPFPIYSNALTDAGLYGFSALPRYKAGSVTVTARGMVGAANFRPTAFTAIGRVLVLTPTTRMDPRFFAHFINGRISFAIESTGVPQLTAPQLATYDAVVPPIDEQKAIAEALRDIDDLIASLDALIAKKCNIKQAAMQQLLTGKTRLPGFSEAWKTKQVGEIGRFLKGSGIRRDQALSGDIPCVRYGEIYTIHEDVIRQFESYISTDVAKSATRLQSGDLLFAGSGETKEEIGKCVAFVDKREAYAGGDIIILRSNWGNPVFLGYLMNALHVVRQKANLGQGDAVVHISARALATITSPMPEPIEQSAIAEVLTSMDEEIVSLVAKRSKSAQLKEGMMQQLLAGKIRLV